MYGQRPFGLTILGVLALLHGLMALCLPIILFFVSGVFTGTGGYFGTGLGMLGMCSGMVLIIVPFLYFGVAYGIMNLRPWAFWLGLGVSGLNILGGILNLLNGAQFWPTLTSMGFSVIIFLYLLTPGVRNAFAEGLSL